MVDEKSGDGPLVNFPKVFRTAFLSNAYFVGSTFNKSSFSKNVSISEYWGISTLNMSKKLSS